MSWRTASGAAAATRSRSSALTITCIRPPTIPSRNGSPMGTGSSWRIAALHSVSPQKRRSDIAAPRLSPDARSEPLGEERLGDLVGAALAPNDLAVEQRAGGLLHRRRRREAVRGSVIPGERTPRLLARQRLEQKALGLGAALPQEREVRVLGSQHGSEGALQLLRPGSRAHSGLLPKEVRELLGRVRVAAGARDQGGSCVADVTSARAEPLGDELGERTGRDRAQLDRLRAAPKRLVFVVEDPLHDVAPAAQVDVRHLGLELEDRPQE